MARIPSLVWAVPMTLALLVLAKEGLRQVGSVPRTDYRAAPAMIERLEPPGRLHAPDDARPMTAAASPPLAKVPAAASAKQTPPATPAVQVNSPSPAVAASPPHREQSAQILYPIAEDRAQPQIEDAFPGIERIVISPQRLPGDVQRKPAAATAVPRATSVVRSPAGDLALSALRQQIAAMNQKAVKLARRGALYSARAELLEALRLLAQTHDAQTGSTQRTIALAAAVTAMDESDDFTPPAGRASIVVIDIIRPHQTPVLKRMDAARLSPLTCSQHYYAYAQQQLGQATAGQAAAANTLSLLGLVHGHLAGQSAGSGSSHTARAIVFHQATLAINPKHYQSANELGVLWARCGELAAARQMLLASLESHPTPSAWHNLAAVHERLGESDLAQLARKEAGLISPKTPSAAGVPSVEWLDAATFAAKSPAADAPLAAGKTQVSTASHASATNQAIRR